MNKRCLAGAVAALWMALFLAGCSVTTGLFPTESSGQTGQQDEGDSLSAHFAGQPLWEEDAGGIAVAAAAPEKTMTQEELLAYESRYGEWMSDVYKEQLSETTTLIYQAILYAADNGYPYLDIPLVWAIEEDNLWDVYSYVALDSPLVESNVRQSTWLVGEGYVQLTNPAFGPAFLDKKEQAVKKAQAVVAAMPDTCVSDQEKARYLYDYLTTYCIYEDYADDTICQSYLYDALCENRGICDGFSNAMTLLLQCAGIPAFEKMRLGTAALGEESSAGASSAPQGDYPEDDGSGHVWVQATLDGVYYNLDPTYDIGEADYCRAALAPMWFMFPDGDSLHTPVFAGEWLPACEQGEVGAFARDLTVTAEESLESLTQQAAEMLIQNRRGEDSYVRIWFEGGVSQDVLRPLVDRLYDRLQQEGWPDGMMLVRQQQELVAVNFGAIYEGDAQEAAGEIAGRLQAYNDIGYGQAIVRFDAQTGKADGEELLIQLQQQVEQAGVDTRVYGNTFDGGDDRYCYWQYWLQQPVEEHG